MSAVLQQPATPSHTLAELPPLKTHNALLGDKAALDEAWESDGYWFFRDVLDKQAVARFRRKYVDELVRCGVIDDPGAAETQGSVRYNGASLANFPFRMDALAERELWRDFVAEPGIDAFFHTLFGEAPFWVPVAEYRATPPAQEPKRSRYAGIHQDGPYSPGIPFRICWFPLAHIDASIGGMMVAEGLTEQVNRHPKAAGSNTHIPVESLPPDRWRHTRCEAGDVLLMNLWTPHTGLTNISDRFRLSLDLRVMESSAKVPAIGRIKRFAPTRFTMTDERNGDVERTFRIDDDTYVRNTVGQKLTPEAGVAFYRPGSPVIVAHDGDYATVVRPPH